MKDNINVALLCGMIQKLTLKMSFRERKFLLILTLLFKKILNYFRSIYILSYFELFNIFFLCQKFESSMLVSNHETAS